MLGDPCRSGTSHFDFNSAGYVKTATEVSSDNSALMRNIRRHEHVLEKAVAGTCRTVIAASRSLGVLLLDEGNVRVSFDDSIIADTAAEKQRAWRISPPGSYCPMIISQSGIETNGSQEKTLEESAIRLSPLMLTRQFSQAPGIRSAS